MPLTEAVKKEKEIQFLLEEPKFTLDEMVLDEKTKSQLEIIISASENWKKVFEDWNFKSVQKYQKNILANFYGKPGTGKTMAAHAVASALKKKIVFVNYSEIESKYVGETSKNLTALFKFAEKSEEKPIIFFDEADALLSKRVTGMEHSNDVSVNQTRSVLLKILNEYTGMVLFATNFIENFDKAFMSRIQYHIEFELPNEELRKKLWRRYIPNEMPNNLDFDFIAKKYEGLSGREISSAVLKSALKAASKNEDSVKQEYFEESAESILRANSVNQGNISNTTTKEVSRDEVVKELGEEKVKQMEAN